MEKKKSMLFDIIDSIFTNKNAVNELSYETCKQNIFMVNRRMAIKYPMQAQAFNNGKANPKDVIKFWCDFLCKGHVQKWVYAKADIKKTDERISPSLLREFSEYAELSIKDVKYAEKNLPDILRKDIKDFEELKKLKETVNG